MLDNSQFSSVLEQSFTENNMRAVLRCLIADAASGDARVRLPARAELFNRLFGKPASRPIDSADDDESAAIKLGDQELLDLFQKQLTHQTLNSQ